jgi:hypothetical protein
MEIASRYFAAGRTVHHGINTPCSLSDNPYHLKAIGLHSGLFFLKKQIKKYSKDRVLIILFAHIVGKTADGQNKPEMTVEDFEALVKFLHQEKQNGDIDVVTLAEGLTRIKEENANRSCGLKFDSPWDKWCRVAIFPIPRRYVTICETVLDDYIGHRLPRISRLVHQLARSLKFA